MENAFRNLNRPAAAGLRQGDHKIGEICYYGRQRARKGEFDKLSDSEREELWADGIITEVEKNLDSIGYLDPVTISLQVIIENDGYSIVDDDLVRMDELVISY